MIHKCATTLASGRAANIPVRAGVSLERTHCVAGLQNSLVLFSVVSAVDWWLVSVCMFAAFACCIVCLLSCS